LCIAYAFPPIHRSGTQRTLGFVKHLSESGWDASVLTVEPAGESLDATLLAQIPRVTQVERVAWLDRVAAWKHFLRIQNNAATKETGTTIEKSKSRRDEAGDDSKPGGMSTGLCDWFTRLLHTPDSRSGWITPAVRRGREVIRRDNPCVIYSTSPYASAHLIAAKLQRRTGLPWVADFRDPWRDNPFRSLHRPTLDWLDARLERRVMTFASHIIMNTPTARDRLCARFPHVAAKCSVIPNGFDFETLRDVNPLRDAPAHHIVLAHAGQFYGSRSPLPWLRALRRAVEQTPQLAQRLRMHLIGAEQYAGMPLIELARREGVAAMVRALGPLPHAETLRRLAGADILLLAGTDGPGADLQVPGKLFEYLALRRPIIASLSTCSPALDILRQACAPAITCASDDVCALGRAIEAMASGRFAEMPDAWSGVERFDRRHRAAELQDLFERLRTRRPESAVVGSRLALPILE